MLRRVALPAGVWPGRDSVRVTPIGLALMAGRVATVVGAATAIVAILEAPPVGLTDASPVYFVAVVIVGSLFGTWPAIATALVAFLVYDLFFTQPTFTLVVSDPREWLDLVLFLVLAVIVGRLSALGRSRAEESSRRAAESSALFAISRILATEPDVEAAAPVVAERLVADGPIDRVWIVRDRPGGPRVLADTAPEVAVPASSFTTSLVRMPGDVPARWVVAHEPGRADDAGSGGSARPRRGGGVPILRVRLEADGVAVGSLKATLRGSVREPDRITTRLLALAADQLALAVHREDLRQEATEAEIARRADALKSALLDAVSHDLRTPLASIRATAGSLADPAVPIDDRAARMAGSAIDAEAERLDRLVREVLDLSRVEAGALRPESDALDLADVVGPVVDRLRPVLGDRPVSIEVPADLPPVRGDAVLLDGLLANLVENVARHAPAPAPLAVRAAPDPSGPVRLTVEDGGPGVPAAEVGTLFEKFVRGPGATAASRRGLGIGLTIVRGFAEAMGATVSADTSPLGGLRVSVLIPAASPPRESVAG
jgi:two-component system sensor histidine kinase KdpD